MHKILSVPPVTAQHVAVGQQVDRFLTLVHLPDPVFHFVSTHELVQPEAPNPLYSKVSRLFFVQLKTSATGSIPTVSWTTGHPFFRFSCQGDIAFSSAFLPVHVTRFRRKEFPVSLDFPGVTPVFRHKKR